MENFQDGRLVADFRLSVLIDWKCRFWLSESAFRKKSTSDDKCLEGVVVYCCKFLLVLCYELLSTRCN